MKKGAGLLPLPGFLQVYHITKIDVTSSDNKWQLSGIIRNFEFLVGPGTSIMALCAGREGLFYKSFIGIIKMIYREFTDMPFTTITPSDVFLWTQKSLYARIYAFSRFYVFYISIYIYSYKYIRNIGTKRTESRLSAGFPGVPEICAGLVSEKSRTLIALFLTSGKMLATSPEQSPARWNDRRMRCRCNACTFCCRNFSQTGYQDAHDCPLLSGMKNEMTFFRKLVITHLQSVLCWVAGPNTSKGGCTWGYR